MFGIVQTTLKTMHLTIWQLNVNILVLVYGDTLYGLHNNSDYKYRVC